MIDCLFKEGNAYFKYTCKVHHLKVLETDSWAETEDHNEELKKLEIEKCILFWWANIVSVDAGAQLSTYPTDDRGSGDQFVPLFTVNACAQAFNETLKWHQSLNELNVLMHIKENKKAKVKAESKQFHLTLPVARLLIFPQV